MLIATAALDMAMWDAVAKALGAPLVVALGGTVGPVRAYNTNGLWLIPLERVADEAIALVAEADFKALKIRLGRDSVKDGLKAIAEVRRAVPADVLATFAALHFARTSAPGSKIADEQVQGSGDGPCIQSAVSPKARATLVRMRRTPTATRTSTIGIATAIAKTGLMGTPSNSSPSAACPTSPTM